MSPNLERDNGHANGSYIAADDEDALNNKKDDTTTTGSTVSSSIDSTDKKKKKKKKKEKKEEDQPTIPGVPPISYFALFRYSSGLDKFLILCAVLASMATGVAFPLMLVVFGDVTNSFVGGGLSPEELQILACHPELIDNSTV